MDEALGLRLKRSGWALAALATPVAGSTAAIELGERTPAEEEAAPGSGRFQRDEQGAEQTAPAEKSRLESGLSPPPDRPRGCGVASLARVRN